MITVGYLDGSVVEYGPIRTVQPATGGPRYTDYGERVIVPPRSAAYREIIAHCAAHLKPDRFACFVVGDVRDSKGFYLNFPADTIAAFQDAGCVLYNEAILVTAVASLSLRAGKQFNSGRKLGKTHQNVLVFYKGNPKNIKEIFGEVEIALPPEEAGNAATDN